MGERKLADLTAAQAAEYEDLIAQPRSATGRPTVEAMERHMHRPYKVLDHGFVRLIDYMGDQAAIVQAARVSYGRGTRSASDDRGLIRYLMKYRHSSPLEMLEVKFHVKLPIFVARQLIRHRTACLSADTVLQFDLPGGIERRGNQLYKLTIGDVWDRFQPENGIEANLGPRRERVQAMHIRCMNEETGEVQHTRIVDIWQNGVRPIFRVELQNGAWFKCTQDHRILTVDGWRVLSECAVGTRVRSIGPGVDTGVVPHFVPFYEEDEDWAPIVGWEGWYEVSTFGRVRRVVGGKGSRSYGRCKKLTVSRAHAVVSLNRPGTQEVRLVHHLVLEAFSGPCPEGMEGCHNDGNSLHNAVSNLRWGTPQSNADDRVRDNATTALRANLSEIVRIEPCGNEMTFDLEVEGPWHNFSANGAVVHNSVNEYSARYSILDKEFYVPEPEQLGVQAKSNKQGRGDEVPEEYAQVVRNLLIEDASKAYDHYEYMLNDDGSGKRSDDSRPMLARELARMNLSLNYYSQWYWKIDLHNLLHFLGLRMDPHAQWEIREFANVKGEIVADWVPDVWQAFIDYRYESKTFSRQEVEFLRSIVGRHIDAMRENTGLSTAVIARSLLEDLDVGKRERDEFARAMGLGVP